MLSSFVGKIYSGPLGWSCIRALLGLTVITEYCKSVGVHIVHFLIKIVAHLVTYTIGCGY